MSKKKRVCCVVGPTASGKTAVGIMLAKEFNGEVVSADSMQIYKELSISTAKPAPEETDGVPHHLIGFKSIKDDYSAAEYVADAKKCIDDITERGRLPIVVGGTGLYIDLLINNAELSKTGRDDKRRAELENTACEHGNAYLLNYLASFDPDSAARLHENDLKRIIRAIEIYETSGKTATQQKLTAFSGEKPYDACFIGLKSDNREALYEKINKRIDIMLENGLVSEAKMFYDSINGDRTSCQAIGIKELFPYFQGNATLEECVELIKQETRRYAKRQISWFKRNKNICWFDIEDNEKEKKIKNFVKNYW